MYCVTQTAWLVCRFTSVAAQKRRRSRTGCNATTINTTSGWKNLLCTQVPNSFTGPSCHHVTSVKSPCRPCFCDRPSLSLWSSLPSLLFQEKRDHGMAAPSTLARAKGLVTGLRRLIVNKTCRHLFLWDCKARLVLSARHGHTMSRVGHQLIVCGGAGRVPIDGPSAPRYLSSVESFCLETEQWTYLSPMRFEAYSPTATGW